MTLRQVGAAFLEQLYDPAVVSMFRLAIASAETSPELARILNSNGFEPTRGALGEMISAAIQAGILIGDPAKLTSRFFALLTGGAHVPVLLGISEPQQPRELASTSRTWRRYSCGFTGAREKPPRGAGEPRRSRPRSRPSPPTSRFLSQPFDRN